MGAHCSYHLPHKELALVAKQQASNYSMPCCMGFDGNVSEKRDARMARIEKKKKEKLAAPLTLSNSFLPRFFWSRAKFLFVAFITGERRIASV